MGPKLVNSWVTEAGLPATIVANPLGILCGYVGVGKRHPWYGKRHTDCTLPSAKPRGARDTDSAPMPGGYAPLPESYLRRLAATLQCREAGWCDHRVESLVDVHGGLTYSGYGYDPMPRDGEWWFGFDCGHAGDMARNMPFASHQGHRVYRDETYVSAECERTARQLTAVGR